MSINLKDIDLNKIDLTKININEIIVEHNNLKDKLKKLNKVIKKKSEYIDFDKKKRDLYSSNIYVAYTDSKDLFEATQEYKEKHELLKYKSKLSKMYMMLNDDQEEDDE